MKARLYRDGVVEREIDKDVFGAEYHVPVKPPMESVTGEDFTLSPPVCVLMDRYNPKYEHYWAEVDRHRDVYESRGIDEDGFRRYVFKCRITTRTRDYHRLHPDIIRAYRERRALPED